MILLRRGTKHIEDLRINFGMMSIEDKAMEIKETFSYFADWQEKYEYIIELGKALSSGGESLKKDEYLIKGCQSRVWLKTICRDTRMEFFADSDALITKGLIAILIELCKDATPEEIFNYDFRVIEEIGLQEHLSPTRSNGLLAMIKRIKEDAYRCMKEKRKNADAISKERA